ncbi:MULTISPECIES: murein biosynthesis integral membrane protein MurJ [Streptomyces]|uniref:murein biosynthesis integral membrane protein MurJ n=1 Tax=Streptomyces TaxID=1883 RepID=UPI0002DECB11|nr:MULTISPECIES: murein biosynthesis integral membrane protein MurJ [Streptomyces]WDI19389.1 murein biosynthesis integral membrane protein MurJ [Streptomyces enissocaesilis]MBQ0915220.1 murein biosynthesis integral membrane protein MurJ [Streptomyces sp. RM99]MBX4177717.1 murein biosynthesis integral membrane protein MurJ [Streptomyces geysiriensis]MCC8454571.1 murein biosynthesis integral membrane protein MurJ [Streptomyces rochei]MDI3096993.1 murein biosynthesis integral membrane protein Mur
MNAPYDGDRGRTADGSGHPEGPPSDPGQTPPQPHADMYLQDAYDQDPYRAQDLSAQDPVSEALYDRAAHPPPPPGAHPQQPLYSQPAQSPYAPDPRVWAQTPAPEPEGPTQYLPYGDDPRTTQFVGVDDLVTQAGEQRHEPDAFAHLFRDQQQGGGHPSYDDHASVPAPAPAPGQYGGAPQQPGQYGTPQGPAPYGNAPAPGQYGGQPPVYGQQHAAPAPGQYAVAPTPEAAEAPLQEPEPTPAPPPAAAPKKGGRAGGLLKSSAVMAAGTMVSRLTGFIRSAMIVSALGLALLGESFQIAYQLPTMIYILTVGGGLNSVFVPQLVRAMKEDDDGGEAYANRLLTLVMVALGLLTALGMLAAPLLVRALSNPVASNAAANETAVTFTRYFLPSIFFMGVHVVMGQILNARGRFGAMMWTPVLNNIVIIVTLGMFLWVYGTAADSGMTVESIPPEGERLLGIGILLGLVVQALAMIPYLRETGFKLRLRFDWKGHGLGKAAMLAKWTILFVLANQAGALVVIQLATASVTDTDLAGTGYSAYANAQLIWGLPQAIITVSLMAALLPRISRSAAEEDGGAVRDDISQGLRTTAVAIVPVSFGFVALGIPMCTLIFGSSGTGAATNMGYMLMAFGLGLIPYSVQYVVLRAFYAYEDTRTPFYNTVIVAVVNAAASGLCYLLLPSRWAVVGMAASYGLAYVIGVGVAWRRLRKRLGGDLDGARVLRTYARLCIASVPAALISGAACYGISRTLGLGVLGSFAALLAGGVLLFGVFFVAARRMRIEEVNSLVGMVRGRLGR